MKRKTLIWRKDQFDLLELNYFLRLVVIIGLFGTSLGVSSCSTKTESGARSVDALMLAYFNALSAKDTGAIASLFPDVELAWGVYEEADRADEKEFRKANAEKLLQFQETFKKQAEEFRGYKTSVTNLKADPERELNVPWSAEPYGEISNALVTANWEGKEITFKFSNIMQYRGRYYLSDIPTTDHKPW